MVHAAARGFQIRFSPHASGCSCNARVAITDQENAMISRKRGFRAMMFGLVAAAGLALAPAAFAGGHVGIGISVPGVSVGYYGGHHGRGYVDVGGYYGGYY